MVHFEKKEIENFDVVKNNRMFVHPDSVWSRVVHVMNIAYNWKEK